MSIPADIRKDFPVLQQEVHGKPLIYGSRAYGRPEFFGAG